MSRKYVELEKGFSSKYYVNLSTSPVYVPLEIGNLDGMECAKIKLPIIGGNKCVFLRALVNEVTVNIPLRFCKIIEVDNYECYIGGESS